MSLQQLGLLLVLSAACGRDGTRADVGEVTQRDSAGIAIIETPGADARAPIGWEVDDDPDLQLGSVDGGGQEQFHWIGGTIGRWTGRNAGGIRGLPDGRIVVVDGSSGELRFFDAEGRFLSRVGSVGKGPGEFQEPLLLSYVSSDSLLIQDFRRISLYSSDGRGYRYLAREEVLGVSGAIMGVSTSGYLTMTWAIPAMGQARQSIPYVISWKDRDSAYAKTVVEFDKLLYLLPPYYGLDVPFTTRPSAAIGTEGFFVVVGDAPDVRAFDTSGRLVRIFRVAESPRPVTQKELDGVIDFEVNRFKNVPAGQTRGVFAQMYIPDHLPAFQFVRVDRDGWIWAELFRPPQDNAQRWMIFDPSGVARGTLELPVGLEVHDIGRDYVLGRWLDADRVEYVRRYRLDRKQ